MVPLTVFNLAIAFIAGILTFFAGCLAPIIPVYVSYLAGSSTKDLDGRTKKTYTRNAILFTLGFILVFLLLGLTVNTFARTLATYRETLQKVSGAFLIIFGVYFLGFSKIPFINRTQKSSYRGVPGTSSGAFLMGLTFGFSWTPCIGPVLAAILFWAGSQSTVFQALPLMLAFSLGLGLPFILIGLSFDGLFPKYQKINTFAPTLQKIAGILLIVFGILVFTGNFAVISSLLLERLGSLAFFIELRQ